MNKQKYYITTPIYYPSGKFHVGHCYSTVIADSLARFKRLKNEDVFFLTGTDEHGQKIEKKAMEESKTPKEYVDEIVEDTKELWKKLGITYDKYIRTTDKEHIECVQKVFQKLYDSDDIYLDEYEGEYCTPCESFWTETQLDNGKCPDCKREVNLVKEKSYFFRLSKYQDRLTKYFEDNPSFLEPKNRQNEMIKNFLEKGLEDLCVSRTTINWGIKVPFDNEHTVYVWLDALVNYISALGYMADDDSKFREFWPANLHLVGKEIFRFHALIWPAVLMALDLPLPGKIYGHGWLVVDGAKISKSLGNYKDPRAYIEETSVDALRYFLLKEVAFGQDGNFSEELFWEKSNSDLSNDLGNLVSRVTAMVQKYSNGELIAYQSINDQTKDDIELVKLAKNLICSVDENMEALNINDALAKIFEVVRKANKYIDLTTPWILAKEDNKIRLYTVMYNLVETIRIVSVCLQPFMIETPKKIFDMLGVEKELQTFDSVREFGNIKVGTIVKKGENLFPRIDLKKEAKKVEEIVTKKENLKETEEPKKDEKGYITIEELGKVELKIGQIMRVERVEKADKLYKLGVDVGEEEVRTIVSGLVPYYKEEELLNKQIIVVTNLKPVKLRGILSQGMLLAAGETDVVKLIVLDSNEGVLPNGMQVR